MNPETRLAEIIAALETVGLNCLVMGGHAVRFYGLDRNTGDYDLHLAPSGWHELPLKLSRTALFASKAPIEGPSWRPDAFRRFQVGTLASGREEWLEFWRSNHLLPPHEVLFSRREEGRYGGRVMAFLSLPDLIRSKETERETDWQDITFLEEFLDARGLAGASTQEALVSAIAQVRSRRGFESHLQRGHLKDRALIRQALARTRLSITQAFLLPSAPEVRDFPQPTVPMEPVIMKRLRTLTSGSNMHLALVEVVRRQYKLAAQAADKADKQAIRAARGME